MFNNSNYDNNLLFTTGKKYKTNNDYAGESGRGTQKRKRKYFYTNDSAKYIITH